MGAWTTSWFVGDTIAIVIRPIGANLRDRNASAEFVGRAVAVLINPVADPRRPALFRGRTDRAFASAPLAVGLTRHRSSATRLDNELDSTSPRVSDSARTTVIDCAIAVIVDVVTCFFCWALIAFAFVVAPIPPLRALGDRTTLDAITTRSDAAMRICVSKTRLGFAGPAWTSVVDSAVRIVIDAISTLFGAHERHRAIAPPAPRIIQTKHHIAAARAARHHERCSEHDECFSHRGLRA
jgi:hypothetical protein